MPSEAAGRKSRSEKGSGIKGRMKPKPLQIGPFTARIPVIQGGMGVGVSLSGLAGAVAAAGGIGVISTAQIGYREPEYDKNPHETNLRQIAVEIDRARELAPDGIIGVNIMVATRGYEEYVRCAVHAGVDLIISGAGLPVTLPQAVREAEKEIGVQGRTLLAPICSSLKSAEVLFHYWKKKYDRLPDLLVIEGPLAGGHLGFERSQLEDIEALHYEEEVKRILQKVRRCSEDEGKSIPVVMAGGIYDRRDAQPWLDLGLDGVQMATRFVTTWECDASQAYKDAYLRAQKEDIVLVKSPVGMPGRAVRNAFLEKAEKEKIPHGPCHGCIKTCRPADTPYCITEALVNAVKGDVENGLIFCGSNAWRAQKMEHVKDIMAEFA